MYKSSNEVNLFRDWMKRTFNRQEMKDMVNHGVNCGFHHLIYYSDTTKLYQKFHQDIWTMLNDDVDMGYKHPLEMMSTFSLASNAVSRITFENLLVWYAAERIAYDLTQ